MIVDDPFHIYLNVLNEFTRIYAIKSLELISYTLCLMFSYFGHL
jgi:hypothetical protein